MANNCEVFVLCDDCEPTVLMPCPLRKSATPAPLADVTADATAVAVNTITRLSGVVETALLPAAAAEGDVVTISNVSLHSITLRDATDTTDVAVIDAGGVVSYRYDNAAWVLY